MSLWTICMGPWQVVPSDSIPGKWRMMLAEVDRGRTTTPQPGNPCTSQKHRPLYVLKMDISGTEQITGVLKSKQSLIYLFKFLFPNFGILMLYVYTSIFKDRKLIQRSLKGHNPEYITMQQDPLCFSHSLISPWHTSNKWSNFLTQGERPISKWHSDMEAWKKIPHSGRCVGDISWQNQVAFSLGVYQDW